MDKELDTKRCIESVFERGFWHSHQCLNKRGKGQDGLYCGLHAAAIARREADMKKCLHCKDTGHYILSMPTKYHCNYCKTGCNESTCGAKNLKN